MKQVLNAIKNVWKWLHESSTGRTLYRGIKTFLYTFLAGLAIFLVQKTGIDWQVLIGQAILAALGFSADKGIREAKSNN